MRWRNRHQSTNIEDRRGQRVVAGRKLGIIGTIVVIAGSLYLGFDPRAMLNLIKMSSVKVEDTGPIDDDGSKFVKTVLADTEMVWNQLAPQLGVSYVEPTLVMFRGVTKTACGLGQQAMGPFYCPGDSKVYIDLDFFDTMDTQLGAPGDFARAYVIAHEVGHHVQNLQGIAKKVEKIQRSSSKAAGNAIQVKMELQADCYAGLWANIANEDEQIIEEGDLEEALNAANQIGDDTLAKKAGQIVVPESFTHGTSKQRYAWFYRGYSSESPSECDTFNSSNDIPVLSVDEIEARQAQRLIDIELEAQAEEAGKVEVEAMQNEAAETAPSDSTEATPSENAETAPSDSTEAAPAEAEPAQ